MVRASNDESEDGGVCGVAAVCADAANDVEKHNAIIAAHESITLFIVLHLS